MGGGGRGAGEVQLILINPKKCSCYGLKNIHTRNLITKKIPAARKFPSPHNFSSVPFLRVMLNQASQNMHYCFILLCEFY